MKKIQLILILLLFSTCMPKYSLGQNGTFRFKGKVLNKNGEGIPFAAIKLTNSDSSILLTKSRLDGQFSCLVHVMEDFQIEISSVAYKPKQYSIKLIDTPFVAYLNISKNRRSHPIIINRIKCFESQYWQEKRMPIIYKNGISECQIPIDNGLINHKYPGRQTITGEELRNMPLGR